MQSFLDKYHSKRDIVDRSGRVLGQHDGVHHYIGQRTEVAAAQPLYVIGLDAGRNRRLWAIAPACQLKILYSGSTG